MKFIHEDFLLSTRTARHLYHQFAEAEPILRKAAQLAPNLAPVQYHFGMVALQLGRKDEAGVALRRALQLDDRLPEASKIRETLVSLDKQ